MGNGCRLLDRLLAYRRPGAKANAAFDWYSLFSIGCLVGASDRCLFPDHRPLCRGVGVGISTVAAPLFISEIAPAKYRGRLAGMFQFNIVFGILIAFVSNALLGGTGENAWRWMLGVEAIPALVYSVMCFGLPESPRWLIGRKNDREAGSAVLRQFTLS